MVKQTLFKTLIIGIQTTVMGFYSGKYRLDSTLNIVWTSRNL